MNQGCATALIREVYDVAVGLRALTTRMDQANAGSVVGSRVAADELSKRGAERRDALA